MDELRVILDAIPAPVFYKDAAGVYRGCNKAFEAYLGKARAEIVGLDVYGLSPKELADVYKAADDKLFDSRGTQIYEARVRYADGTYHDVMFHKACFFNPDGELAGLVGTILDITSRKQAEHALAESEQRYRAVVSALGEGIVLLAKDAAVLAVNPAAEQILGLSQAQLAAGAPWPFIDDRGTPIPFDEMPMAHTLTTGADREYSVVAIRRADGGRAWVSLSARAIAETGAVVVSFADITERRVFQQQLEHAALHDALTGLPNRKLFMDRLDHALELARRRNEKLGVAFIDLDGFKAVNDSLGHEIGDRLLAEVGRRLAGALRGSDLIARLGGDEFCAILSGIADADTARLVGERMLDAVQPALEVSGRRMNVTASIGIALYPDHATEPAVLLRHADDAMYRVKSNGKNAIGLFAAILLALMAFARPAAADDEQILHKFNLQMWDHDGEPAEPAKLTFGTGGLPNSDKPPPIIAHAADGKSVWVAAELAVPHPPCGGMDLPDCDKNFQPENESHATVLFDGGNAEHPLVVHVGDSITPADQAKAKPAALAALQPKVGPGAEDVVKQFGSTLADPKAFAKTVSDRGDVVLYGSDQKERFVGGANVRATLEKWHLAIAVRDGIQAGVTSSKTVAWVAANVEVRDAGKAKAKTTPYRLTAIYERTGTAWKLVLVHFSFVKGRP